MSANARPSAALLGADAGGSHSTVVIGTADLTILGRADGPGSAMKPGGAAASAVVLAETARRAASQAGIHLPVGRAVVGAAGAGRAQEQRELEAALVQTGLAQRVRVMADAEIALSTAFADGTGIIVSAGTGSIAYARDPAGELHRAGGYGWNWATRAAAIGWGGARWTSRPARTTAGARDRPCWRGCWERSACSTSTTWCAGRPPPRRRRWRRSRPTSSM